MSFPRLLSQWHHPTGLFSILLIVRGDVIQKALAQLAGGPYKFTPVAFSFGWVSYAVTTLLSAIGEGKLMPDVECASMVINAREGSRRTNASWVLGRMLRDWEMRARYGYEGAALVVGVFRVGGDIGGKRSGSDLERHEQDGGRGGRRRQGVPVLDTVWVLGVVVMVVQCVVAVLAVVIDSDWLILIVTFGGTLLALAGGALPQWRKEKWACRPTAEDERHGKRDPKTIILTRGNGHRHVMIIVDSNGTGLDLEDLAAGRINRHRATLPAAFILAVLWVFLLLLATNLVEDVWYLVVIGCLGMAQNGFTAAHCRDAGAFGIHLGKPVYILPDLPSKDENGKEKSNKVFQVLKKTETKMSEEYGIPCVGILLLPVFFPAGLRPCEVEWQREREHEYEQVDEKKESKEEQERQD